MPRRARLTDVRRLLLTFGFAALVLMACGDGATSADATDTTTTTTAAPRRDPNQRYRATATVLESPDHGPELCLGVVLTSLPPQCGGPSLVGWDWGAVDGEESANGTSWIAATVIGTFDGTTFSLTEPARAPATPARRDDGGDFTQLCTDPDGDPSAEDISFEGVDHPQVAAVWVTDDGPGGDPLIVNVVARPSYGDDVRAAARRSWPGLLCVAERDQPTRAELQAVQSRVDMRAPDTPFGGMFSSGADELRGVVRLTVALGDDVSKAWAREHWGPLVEVEGLLEPVP
jgi:hypothetical protein